MAHFKTKLRVELVAAGSKPVWQLQAPFVFVTDVLDTILVVPTNFLTDFASVPRLPLAYTLTGNLAHEAAVIHDWLYSKECKDRATRKQADDVFYEAAIVVGTSEFRAWLMWLGVRAFGQRHWKKR